MIHDPKVQALIEAVDDYHPNSATKGITWDGVLAARAALRPEPTKPRNFWLVLGRAFRTENEAENYSNSQACFPIPIHVREVLK